MKSHRCRQALLLIGFVLVNPLEATAQQCIDPSRDVPDGLEIQWKLPIGSIKVADKVLARISQVAGVRPMVEICQSEKVNAFALRKSRSQSYMRLNSSLIAALADDADALAFIIAHEFGHILLDHSRLSLEVHRSLTFEWYQAYLAGSAELANQYLGQIWHRFGRDKERDADDLGHALMVKAGYDSGGGLRALELFAEKNRQQLLATYLSTHPGILERAFNSAFRELNEQYREQAQSSFLRRNDAALRRTLQRWDRFLPPSGARHFYQALLQLKEDEPWSVIIESFDDANSNYLGELSITPGGSVRSNPGADLNVVVTSGFSALAQAGQWERPMSALGLCTALYHDDQKVEALECVASLEKVDVERFKAVTGWSDFIVMTDVSRKPAKLRPIYGGVKGSTAILTDSPFLAIEEELRESRPRAQQKAPLQLPDFDFSKVKAFGEKR